MDGIRKGTILSGFKSPIGSSILVQSQTVPDEPLDNENEDDLSDLEELYPDETVSQQKAETIPDVLLLSTTTMQVLERFTTLQNDPMMVLTEFYTKRLKLSVKDFFHEEPPLMLEGRSFFHTSFQCPITNLIYYSSLPIVLFHENHLEGTVFEQRTKQLFGDYRIQKHHVVFSSKKYAKRAVAMAVLEAHNMLGVNVSTGGHKLFSHNSPFKSLAASSQSAGDDVMITTPITHKYKAIPSWVHEIYDIGVRFDTLEIVYKEKFVEESSRIATPTTLCCILTIQQPIQLKVVGCPSPTKQAALESAVVLLVEEVRRQTSGTNTTTTTQTTPKQAQAEKERLLNCNPALANYISHISNWTTAPLPKIMTKTTTTSQDDMENGTTSTQRLYLYRLELLDTRGNHLATARTGLKHPTPLGVLFTTPIPISSCESAFPMKKNGSTQFENVIVRLSKGAELTTNSLHNYAEILLTRERLQHLIQFNREIQDWKRYGLQSATEMDTSEQVLDGRTYMFTPLVSTVDSDSWNVDWNMLRDIHNKILKPYIEAIDAKWYLPLLGHFDLLFVSYLFWLISLVVLALDTHWSLDSNHLSFERFHLFMIRLWNHMLEGKINELLADMNGVLPSFSKQFHAYFGGALSDSEKTSFVWEHYYFFALLSISLVSYLCYYFFPPRRHFTDDELSNRFLTSRFKFPSGKLLVTKCGGSFRSYKITGRSKCRTTPCDDDYINHCQQKWKYDPSTVTFAERSARRNGTRIRFGRIPLLQVYNVSKVSAHDPFLEPNYEGYYLNLFPESIMVHPIPKDVLYLLRHETAFMRALDFEMESFVLAAQLTELSETVSKPYIKLPSLPVSKADVAPRSLPRLLEEACTLIGKDKYQRLEFLGDAVLGYFIALNLMARNAQLKWDFDELTDLLSGAARNTALFDASLRIGLSHMLRHDNKWKSVFRSSSSTFSNISETMSLESTLLMGSSLQSEVREVRDKTMADIAESLLGVAFLVGQQWLDATRSNMIIALLNGFMLPLATDGSKTEETGWPWFRAMGCCLVTGYPFGLDQSWQKQLVTVGTALYTNNEAISELTRGYNSLVAKLVELSGRPSLPEILNAQSSKILLLCSIFDDSLKDNSDSGSIPTNGSTIGSTGSRLSRSRSSLSGSSDRMSIDEQGLFRAAMTRDTLALLGASSLQLCITHELFKRYPNMQQGGLHVLKAIASNDDCVAYVFFKAGFDAFLFDQEAPCIATFKTEMVLSDGIGQQKWDARGGWILDGGKEEFKRRWTLQSDRTPEPKYMGIGGGRLYSHPNTKLPETVTADLVFSFKSIIGALVLSIGVDGMWQCLGPIFEELLLLAPEEVKREYSFSTIVQGL